MQRIKRKLGSIAVLALALTASPAAVATDVCVVQSSTDGYVALRAAPSASGALIVRAKAGEAVVIQKSGNGDQIMTGRWVRVIHYPDTVVPEPTDPNFKKGRIGWMHRRYVDDCG